MRSPGLCHGMWAICCCNSQTCWCSSVHVKALARQTQVTSALTQMVICKVAGGRENGEAAGHTEGPRDMDVDGAAHSAAAALADDSAAAAAPGTDAAAEPQVAPAQMGAGSSCC